MKQNELAKEVAKKTGFSVSHVTNVLNGRRQNDQIKQVAEQLVFNQTRPAKAKAAIKEQKRKDTKATVEYALDHSQESLTGALGFEPNVDLILRAMLTQEQTSQMVETILKGLNVEVTKQNVEVFMSGFILHDILNAKKEAAKEIHNLISSLLETDKGSVSDEFGEILGKILGAKIGKGKKA